MRRATGAPARAAGAQPQTEQSGAGAPLPDRLSHLLVLACGNSLRRDDGAGLLLAERLVQQWRAAGLSVRHVAVQQWTPELALEIAAAKTDAVLFVDAGVPAAASAIDVRPVEPAAPSPSLGHHLTPPTLLLYAKELYGQQPPTWLVTVPGVDFALGEGVSPPVQALLDAAETLARELLALIARSSK